MKMKELREKIDECVEAAKDVFAHIIVPPPEVVEAEKLASNLTYVDVEPPPEARMWVFQIVVKLKTALLNKVPPGQGKELKLKLEELQEYLDAGQPKKG